MIEVRYTAKGDDEVEARIAADQVLIAQGVQQLLSKDLFVSLILIGGYARGEGGFVKTELGAQAYNDFDYFVVVNDCSRKVLNGVRDRLASLAHSLELRVGVEVDFFPLKRSQIAKLPYTLMYSEMQAGHRVVVGDPNILDNMPAMPLDQVPTNEFRRLMLNRGTLLLLNQRDREEGRTLCPDRMGKYLNKAVLACGDHLLHQKGCYTASYQIKQNRLAELENVPEDLLYRYRRAVDHKLDPMSVTPTLEEVEQSEPRVVDHWLSLFSAGVNNLPPVSVSGAVRNILVNFRQDGVLKTLSDLKGALIYPRTKLFAALPVLLSQKSELGETARLLGLASSACRAQIIERYLELWHRYS